MEGRYAVIGCKLKQDANEGCNSCAKRVVEVLQDVFYVLLHVLFYVLSLLYSRLAVVLSGRRFVELLVPAGMFYRPTH